MAKRTWLDGQVGNTPITAARLNDLEDDVELALTRVASTSSNVLIDTDGTPYFQSGSFGGPTIQADTDGVPYFI